MIVSLAYLTRGLTLGLSAGFSPGPFTTLVITESLNHGPKAGMRMALAPFITDTPIILAAVVSLSYISDMGYALSAIGFIGALVLLRMGWKSLRLKEAGFAAKSESSPSLRKGVLVNFTNPNPYLFWFTICGPELINAYREDPIAPFLFIAAFYACLVGVKMGIALLVGKSGGRLSSRNLLRMNRILGLLLWVYAIMLGHEALMRLIA